jgi:ELWxxDGT repeat protein
VVCVQGSSRAATQALAPQAQGTNSASDATGKAAQPLPIHAYTHTDRGSEFIGGAGRELWRSDGTVEGTLRLDDVFSGSTGSNPSYLTSFGEYVYFAATSASEGRELWRTKGSEVGAAEIVPQSGTSSQGIYPGPSSSNPSQLTVADNFLFFAATDPYRGRELWYRHYVSGDMTY